MKKVFQTIVSPNHGNCMQAVVASLFDLELEQVPNFIELGDRWYSAIHGFFKDRGYGFNNINLHAWVDTQKLKEVARRDGGIEGYLYGVVKSQTFEGGTHAVVVDTDLNIVHDPNPNQKALSLKPEDVIAIQATKNFCISENGKIRVRR